MVAENCVRINTVVGEENVYWVVGDTFVDVTLPHENRPDRLELRCTIDRLCEAVSELMEPSAPQEERDSGS